MNGIILKNAIAGIKRLKEREIYEESLIDFAEYVWPVVEPAIPMVRGWAMEAICDHLEAVTDGHIRRLLINVPPGFSKSLLTDVFWPAWIWGPCNRPWTRFMCAAYSNHLTERDNMRCRNIVISDRYKALWGKRFGISNEQFTKIKFANDQTGWKLATSVGGIGTGERADIVIIDDPNNPMEMESEAVRATTNMWFTEVMPDRLNNQAESSIVVIQQRTHEDDVSGIALSREMGYTHLMIPMYHDTARHCSTVLWEDPRIDDGELAWPERFPEQIVQDLQRDKGEYAWAGQYQQSPEPRGGSIIKRHFWQLWEDDKYPNFEYILGSLDTAYTEKKENDPSALVILGVFRDANNNPKIMLVHAWQERLQFNELVQRVIGTCTISMAPKDYPSFPIDRLLIEGKASGLSVAQEIYRLIGASGKFGIDAIDPKKYGDKVSRVHSIQHIFADEMVYAPDKAWADMVIDQVSVFPKGSHDDLCLVAGTQISTRRGSIPIEQILDDDEVITPLGWRRVTGHGFTGWRQVINVGPLTGTGNHPVFSLDSGFMRMDSISLEQLVRFNLCDLIRTIRQKSLISMDKPIEEWVERENTISLKQQEMLTERKPKGFMSRFGSTFQGWISQRVTKFITRTVIPSIAALKIWSAYRSACIAVCLKRLIQSDSLLIWNVLDHLQRLGILPQRGSNGIVSTPSKVSKSLVELGYLELKEQKNVFGAGIDLNINYQLESSALRDVVSNQVSSNAVKADIFIHDLRPVFNLSVEEAKCYYANGVLVHNCDAVSMGLRYLRDQGFALRRDESSLAREDDMRYVSPSANLPLYPT